MTNSRTFLCVALAVVVAACGRKEQPPPVPSQAPPTTVPVTTTTTTMPAPPPVWRTAQWGMTKDEVLAAFPKEAQRRSPPVPYGPATPGSTDVLIPTYESDGVPFRVLLGFDPDRLNRIHLNAVKPVEATCGDLEKALTAKHGAPAVRNNTGTSLRGEEIDWKLADQTITLSCAGVFALGFRTVTVIHTPPG